MIEMVAQGEEGPYPMEDLVGEVVGPFPMVILGVEAGPYQMVSLGLEAGLLEGQIGQEGKAA